MAQGHDAGAEAVEAGEHGGVGRGRGNVGRVVLFKEHGVCGKAVDMGRGLAVVSITAHAIGAQAVDAEDNDVGLFGWH